MAGFLLTFGYLRRNRGDSDEGLAHHQRGAVSTQCPVMGLGGEAAGNCHGMARGGSGRTLRRHEDGLAFELRSPGEVTALDYLAPQASTRFRK